MTQPIDPVTLAAIERHFHDVIRERADAMHIAGALAMPRLVDCRGSARTPAWFAVPGMYGGFAYWIEMIDAAPTLICESWSRIIEGSGQRHVITVSGSRLQDTGFV